MMNRPFLLSAFLLSLCGAMAQGPAFIYFETLSPVAPGQLKRLTETLVSVDAGAELFHSDDYRILQLKSSSLQAEGIYRAFLEANGIQLKAGTRTAEDLGLNAAPTVPVYISTGDEQADMARYRAAVDQWNTVHPQQPISAMPVHQQR